MFGLQVFRNIGTAAEGYPEIALPLDTVAFMVACISAGSILESHEDPGEYICIYIGFLPDL